MNLSDERYEETCIVDKLRRRVGWMLWASFFGNEEGPSLFWEKEWGSITSRLYSDRIVPLIHDIVTSEPRLSVMQDNAPPHKAARTTEDFRERAMAPFERLPFSPDLYPIEAVWNLMKNYIQFHYPDLGEGRQRTQDDLRIIVKEARDNVSADNFLKLIETMPARCQAVLDADGGHTNFQFYFRCK